jgi:hypothetical protein
VPDGRGQGDVAEGGGVGLPSVGEPADERGEGLSFCLAWLAGGEQDPAVAADGVAGRAGFVDDGEAGWVMSGRPAASAVMAAVVGRT